jgi:predicted metal-binding membrane protein
MLVMLTVEVGNLGWMPVLGGLMGIEKNVPWGRRFAKPLGVALLICSGIVAFL